ncbi:hypothetical protein Gohar_025350 [Gossypium harknessii]|uniref:DUF4283 domain-containing protein n=1 Tax=Gossypium harknessii TaxID=34285 RepID=A0A7J9HJX9_9ROSI|nr:hypothetical protein [Gossypium harknessii]
MEFFGGGFSIGSNSNFFDIGFGQALKKVRRQPGELPDLVYPLVDRNSGRIAFNALSNKLYALWKLNKLIQVMVLENDFYLVKFHDDDDYSKVLTDGPWVVFKHYLYVHPCFPSSQHHKYSPTNMVVWVRLPGQFARLVICIDLGKPLISMLRIDGTLQRVEYKSVPAVYFGFGNCGRNKELCLHKMPTSDKSSGSWMIVMRRQRRDDQPTGIRSNKIKARILEARDFRISTRIMTKT